MTARHPARTSTLNAALVLLAAIAPGCASTPEAPPDPPPEARVAADGVIGRWHDGAELDALLVRLEPGQSVIMEVGADWCGPCNQLAWEVLESDRGALLLAESAGLRVDFESPDGHALAGRYGVINLPTTVVIGPDGKELGRVEGYDGPEPYLTAIAEVTRTPVDVAAMARAADGAPLDHGLQLAAGRAQLFAGQVDAALERLTHLATDRTVDAEIAAEAARTHGRWLVRVKGDAAAAVPLFQAAATRFSEFPRHVAHFTYWTATAMASAGRRDDARALIDAWLGEASDAVMPLAYAVEFFVHNAYPPDIARPLLERLVALDGWDADRRYTEARILHAAGETDGARRAIAAACALEPANALYRNYAAGLAGAE